MSWQGFRWIGTDADLIADTKAHAEDMARKQAAAADLRRAILLAKGRC